MKTKSLLIVATLILLIAIVLIFQNQQMNDRSADFKNLSNQSDTNATNDDSTSGNRKSSNTKSVEDEEFNPFAKLPQATKKTYTYAELEKILRLNSDFTETMRINTCDYYYNDEGKIIKIEKNKGLYPTVSKWSEVGQRFAKRGFQIKKSSHLPYDVDDPALKNLYGKILFQRFDSHSYLSDPLIAKNEFEIFPCKFVLSKEKNSPEYFGIEVGKVYDGVFVVESSGERYEENVSPVIGAEGIPWELSLWRHYSLFGFMEYKKHPELPRLLPEGTFFCRQIGGISVYELRTDK